MSYIRKLPSGRFQAQIRRADLKTISKTFKLRKDAVKWATSIEASDAKLEKLGSYNSQTLASLIDQYQNHYDQQFDAGLVKDDHVTTRLAFWKKELGDVKLLDLNSDHIRAGIQILIEDRNLKPQSTNRYLANISKAVTWAIKQVDKITKQKTFIIKDNPCRIGGQKEGKGRKRIFSEQQVTAFLDAAKQSTWDQFYLMALMGAACGARRSELLKLTWKDINFSSQEAYCSDTKNGTNRTLPLTDAVIVELKKFRGIGIDDQPVFSMPGRRTVDYRHVWSAALRLAEIPTVDQFGEKLVFHSLRHTFCTRLIENNVNLATVKELAGHKTITTTQRYIHIAAETKKSTIADVFGMLGGVK